MLLIILLVWLFQSWVFWDFGYFGLGYFGLGYFGTLGLDILSSHRLSLSIVYTCNNVFVSAQFHTSAFFDNPILLLGFKFCLKLPNSNNLRSIKGAHAQKHCRNFSTCEAFNRRFYFSKKADSCSHFVFLRSQRIARKKILKKNRDTLFCIVFRYENFQKHQMSPLTIFFLETRGLSLFLRYPLSRLPKFSRPTDGQRRLWTVLSLFWPPCFTLGFQFSVNVSFHDVAPLNSYTWIDHIFLLYDHTYLEFDHVFREAYKISRKHATTVEKMLRKLEGNSLIPLTLSIALQAQSASALLKHIGGLNLTTLSNLPSVLTNTLSSFINLIWSRAVSSVPGSNVLSSFTEKATILIWGKSCNFVVCLIFHKINFESFELQC